jgi:hypothetical protein
MALNCECGDLALVIDGPSTGKLVTCIELLPAGAPVENLPFGWELTIDESVGPLWRVDRFIVWPERHTMHLVPDKALMPVRPEPDEGAKESGRTVARSLEP